MYVDRQIRTSAVRLHVLHHAAEGEIHGAWMSAELAEHGHRISAGTLYPLLHRMEEAGLLTSRTDVRDGRRLRLYRATRRGRDALRKCRAALVELSEELVTG